MTLQIKGKGGGKAIITGREGKEKEGDHDYIGIKGVRGVQPSPPDLHPNCRNTATRSLMTTGQQPSASANRTHACRGSVAGMFSLLFLGISYFPSDILEWM